MANIKTSDVEWQIRGNKNDPIVFEVDGIYFLACANKSDLLKIIEHGHEKAAVIKPEEFKTDEGGNDE